MPIRCFILTPIFVESYSYFVENSGRSKIYFTFSDDSFSGWWRVVPVMAWANQPSLTEAQLILDSR